MKRRADSGGTASDRRTDEAVAAKGTLTASMTAGISVAPRRRSQVLLKPQGEKMKGSIWLSYDLGVSGDYEGMYSWLENHGAKECGSSVAFLKNYEFENDLLEHLMADIGEAVTLNRRSRIYVIFRDNDRSRGRYLVGRRKAPPWTGFGDESEEEADEDW